MTNSDESRAGDEIRRNDQELSPKEPFSTRSSPRDAFDPPSLSSMDYHTKARGPTSRRWSSGQPRLSQAQTTGGQEPPKVGIQKVATASGRPPRRSHGRAWSSGRRSTERAGGEHDATFQPTRPIFRPTKPKHQAPRQSRDRARLRSLLLVGVVAAHSLRLLVPLAEG